MEHPNTHERDYDPPEYPDVAAYIPMTSYSVDVNGIHFVVYAEVERVNDGKAYVTELGDVCIDGEEDYIDFPDALLNSYTTKDGPTWRELIEREVAIQADTLNAFHWRDRE